MRRLVLGVVVIASLTGTACGSDSGSVDTSASSPPEATVTSPPTTTESTLPPTTSTTEAPDAVAATTADGQAVPAAVLDTAEQIYRAAQAQDLAALGQLAGAPDFTYSFGDPPGDPVAHWSGDPTATSEMVRVLEQSVATDGSFWWWPADLVTDETYFGFRIGIDNAGTWRFAVAGD